MRHVSRLCVGLAVVLAAGCAEQVTSPADTRAPVPRPAFNTSGDLQVSVTDNYDEVYWGGPAQAGVPFTMTASATGGSGSYYYIWSMYQCIHYPNDPDIWIYCPDAYTIKEGLNENTLTITPMQSDVEWHVLLEVRGAQAGYTSGAVRAYRHGPSISAYGTGPDYGNPFNFCARQQSGWYPFEEWKVVNNAYKPTGREYRRNACDGYREFNPAKPDTTDNIPD
jgi:hypothetical protein